MKGRKLHLFNVVQILAVGVLLWLLVTWNTPWNIMRYVGTVLAVAGVSLVGVARYQLGKSFSIKPEAHELVTHGLYSKIRNPIYVFGGVMMTGLLLVLQKPVLWVVFTAMVVAQAIRARREARMLETAFGDAYREYRSRTWL